MCSMMIFFETVSPKAGNPSILSHWQKLSRIRLDGKTEKVKSRISRESKSTSKEARVVPEAIAEPDLFELEEEVPTPCFRRRRSAAYRTGYGARRGYHIRTDPEAFIPNEEADGTIPTVFGATKYGLCIRAF
jgi:hypothetical protein